MTDTADPADVNRAQAVSLIYNAKNKTDTGARGRRTERQFSSSMLRRVLIMKAL